jgi:hypothetical protein
VAASDAKKDATSQSVESLLGEFGVLRSAVIRRIEGREPQGAEFDAEICLCR